MRLIDADKIDFGKVFIGDSNFAIDAREGAQFLIDAQPTAYDVEKVVERIEGEKFRVPDCGYEEGINKMCNVAINIIKTGGANG